MKRVFWVSLGAVAGVLIVRKVSAVARKATPAGMQESVTGALGGLGASLRYFADEIRAGMDEREGELREALGLDGRHDVVDSHTLADEQGLT